MDLEQLLRYLDHPAEAETWLQSWGLADPRHGHENLVRLAQAGLTIDLLADICGQLAEHLPRLSDADMALNNLDRFVTEARNPLSLGSLFERDRDALPILLQIFSISQHLSDVLIQDKEAYDLLRLTEGQPVNRETLVAELATEIEALDDETAALSALRRFKRRETLRICYGDLIRGQRLETVTAQISHLADALIEAALRFARRRLLAKRGEPRGHDGQPARFAVLAMGKLGGAELNYSSDIDLIFLYDRDGQTDGPRSLSNGEFFDRLAQDLLRLLSDTTPDGQCYRVDMRLRPHGQRGPLVQNVESAMRYYDVMGRTWERQAFVKARAAAGALDLGREFLAHLESWIYRRYLSRADISGIKALKRRIEHRTLADGHNTRDVKTGHGGIRDVEFVIQFLQLLNGGDLVEVRTGNTVDAIRRLESVGCLTQQERGLLEEHYSFLRKIEHRLQIMFDLQTHLIPSDPSEVRKLAIRLGYADTAEQTALARFEADLRNATSLNRKILDHLLHDAFGDDAQAEPEVDLVLDPDPPEERIREVLGKYPFRDVMLAYKNLMALSEEKIRFLSTRRCRHFLASIAPRLLAEIAATSDPDSTLIDLEKVSDSIGGKGVLWELFSFNPPSMKLYVELCAFSPYLTGILVSNPGMIDELMDSLVLNKLPTCDDMRQMLADLTRGAENIDPILHTFKSTQQLRVGVRDILGKEDIRTTIASLSDIAETCLEQITLDQYRHLVAKLGEPTHGEGPRAGQPCELVILALGKLGGRELNYHSDLDIVFLYEADGTTQFRRRGRTGDSTTNNHFFSELGQRIIKVASQLGPQGRLYEVDPRLRPTGRSGSLATSFAEFARYFAEGHGQLWERQALCRARVVFGSADATERAQRLVATAAFEHPWQGNEPAAIRDMRRRLEESAVQGNLKRGAGGLVDIEFLVQMLQLKYGRTRPEVRQANTLSALSALHEADLLSTNDFTFFGESYRFLRTLEGRLRLMNTTARDDLPTDLVQLAKLAHSLGFADDGELLERCRHYTTENRRRFDARFRREAGD